MVMHSPLDDRETATIAWARYRRRMWGMALVSLVAVVIAILYLHWSLGDAMTIHMFIATAAGFGLSVLLGAALLGLVFLSICSGHDEANDYPFTDDTDLQP